MLCHYAECHVLFTIMVNVTVLSVVVLSVVAPFLGQFFVGKLAHFVILTVR